MRWRSLLVVTSLIGLVIVVGTLLVIALNLIRFERSSTCESAASADCVLVSPAVITSPSRHVRTTSCGTGPASGGCHDRDDYSIAVTPAGSTTEVELWDTRQHPDFRVGDSVRLELWHGHYIAVTDGGHRLEVNDWKPRLLEWILAVTAASALIAGLLWRLGLLGIISSPAKRPPVGLEGAKATATKAKLRAALSVIALVYWVLLAITLLYVAVPASSPLLYLR